MLIPNIESNYVVAILTIFGGLLKMRNALLFLKLSYLNWEFTAQKMHAHYQRWHMHQHQANREHFQNILAWFTQNYEQMFFQ